MTVLVFGVRLRDQRRRTLPGAGPGDLALEVPGRRCSQIHDRADDDAELQGDGQREEAEARQSVTYTWSIKGVSPDGVADITQRIERVTMKIEAPPYMPFEFDSNTPASRHSRAV